MTRRDLQELAEVRLEGARALTDAGRSQALTISGAYYLAGYAIECALKACIAKQYHEHEFPDLKKMKLFYSHMVTTRCSLPESRGLNHFLDRATAARCSPTTGEL